MRLEAEALRGQVDQANLKLDEAVEVHQSTRSPLQFRLRQIDNELDKIRQIEPSLHRTCPNRILQAQAKEINAELVRACNRVNSQQNQFNALQASGTRAKQIQADIDVLKKVQASLMDEGERIRDEMIEY